MNTFLKMVLLIALAVAAVKLLPVTLGIGCMLGLAFAVMAALGLSLIAAILCAAAVLGALLSPLWLPVLALLGLIALIKRADRSAA